MTWTRSSTTVLWSSVPALAAAFVLLPRPVASALSGGGYGDGRQLAEEVSAAFVGYWRTGRQALPPELQRLVDYWRWYHLVKAVTAIGLLVVLLLLAARLRTRYAHAHDTATIATWPSTAGGIAAAVLSPFAFMGVLANVQGTVAPFSSLLSLLPVTTAQGDLASTIGQIQQQAAHYPEGSSAALRMIVGDLTVYHAVVAAMSVLTASTLVGLLVAWWRTTAGGRTRRPDRPYAVVALLTASFLAVVGFANATTAVDSPTAVLNFFRGAF